MTPEIINVRPSTGDGKTRAFATVKLGLVTISSVKLIDGKNGSFVAGPANKDKHGRWHALVSFEPSLEAELLSAFETALANGPR